MSMLQTTGSHEHTFCDVPQRNVMRNEIVQHLHEFYPRLIPKVYIVDHGHSDLTLRSDSFRHFSTAKMLIYDILKAEGLRLKRDASESKLGVFSTNRVGNYLGNFWKPTHDERSHWARQSTPIIRINCPSYTVVLTAPVEFNAESIRNLLGDLKHRLDSESTFLTTSKRIQETSLCVQDLSRRRLDAAKRLIIHILRRTSTLQQQPGGWSLQKTSDAFSDTFKWVPKQVSVAAAPLVGRGNHFSRRKDQRRPTSAHAASSIPVTGAPGGSGSGRPSSRAEGLAALLGEPLPTVPMMGSHPHTSGSPTPPPKTGLAALFPTPSGNKARTPGPLSMNPTAFGGAVIPSSSQGASSIPKRRPGAGAGTTPDTPGSSRVSTLRTDSGLNRSRSVSIAVMEKWKGGAYEAGTKRPKLATGMQRGSDDADKKAFWTDGTPVIFDEQIGWTVVE